MPIFLNKFIKLNKNYIIIAENDTKYECIPKVNVPEQTSQSISIATVL